MLFIKFDERTSLPIRKLIGSFQGQMVAYVSSEGQVCPVNFAQLPNSNVGSNRQ